MSNPRVLLLAATTGYQTRVFAEAGERLGIDLALATDRCHVLEDPWGDRAIPLRFEDPPASAQLLIEEGRRRPFRGMVALGDRPPLIAALAAAALGMVYNSPASVSACHDKYLARQLYKQAGLAVPDFFRLALGEDPVKAARQASFPCVLKPLGLSASRGVIRADNPQEFVAAFRRIKALLETPEILSMREQQNCFVQVETYIEGREFALEGLLTGGRLQVLALFDKPDPLEGPFFEESIYVTPSRAGADIKKALVSTTERAIHALGLTQGPIHAELRFNARGVWMLEMAARPIGGLCAQALRFNDGMPLEELILRHAMGQQIPQLELCGPASGVMMIPIPKRGVYEGVSGLEEAGAVPGITKVIITAKQGQTLVPLPEGASYLGFIFSTGDLPERVESALRESHSKLEFHMATVLPVIKT